MPLLHQLCLGHLLHLVKRHRLLVHLTHHRTRQLIVCSKERVSLEELMRRGLHSLRCHFACQLLLNQVLNHFAKCKGIWNHLPDL